MQFEPISSPWGVVHMYLHWHSIKMLYMVYIGYTYKNICTFMYVHTYVYMRKCVHSCTYIYK